MREKLDRILNDLRREQRLTTLEMAALAGKLMDKAGVNPDTFKAFWDKLCGLDKDEFACSVEDLLALEE